MSKILKSIMLMQPNFAIFGKRTWELPPYNLGLLNAALKPEYNSYIFDPNFSGMDEARMRAELKEKNPDIVGITSFSTEYVKEINYYSKLIKDELPNAILILGGIIPTVIIEQIIEDENIDFFITAEGEYRLKALIDALNGEGSLSSIDGLAYRKDGVNFINRSDGFIDNLDLIAFPDYGDLDIRAYGNKLHKFCAQLIPEKFPVAYTITTRGCPFNCVFCAAHTISGKKVRVRSAQNVLTEVDILYNDYGIREIIFLDDHFFTDKERAIAIMKGIIQRNYDMKWKCGNVAAWAIDEEILELMKASGSYQMTISPESGNQDVLKNIIKKPLDLAKTVKMVRHAQTLGIDIISNFIIGFPGETWSQIRETIQFAEDLDIEMVNFHVATPLPKTELMQICLDKGYIKDDELFGYTKGVISTDEFTSLELQILRAFEWDRINFKTPEKIKKIAKMEGLTLEEVDIWRRKTRNSLGMTTEWESFKEKIS